MDFIIMIGILLLSFSYVVYYIYSKRIICTASDSCKSCTVKTQNESSFVHIRIPNKE